MLPVETSLPSDLPTEKGSCLTMILAEVDPDPSVPVLFCSKDVDFQIQRTYLYGVRYLNDFFTVYVNSWPVNSQVSSDRHL